MTLRSKRITFLSSVTILVAGCTSGGSGTPAICDASARAGIDVEIRGSDGERVCDAVVELHSANSEVEGLEAQPDCHYYGAYESVGSYTVVASGGDLTAEAADVQVTKVGCHVETQAVDLVLR